MAFEILHSSVFERKLEKFPKDFKDWLDKIECQLAENPYVGDPIKVPWLREKKRGKYRVYYIIYEDIKKVYLVAISEKKDQQVVINSIWLSIKLFRDNINNLVKK